ncbi:MAG: aminotransferase class IV [Planctomycetota bacterium]
MTPRWAYFNGDWIDDRRLAIPHSDTGFMLGVTVTERLRTFRGEPFRVAEHLRRMRRSLEIIGLDAAVIVDEVQDAIDGLLQRNGSSIAVGDDWAVVAFATPGGPTNTPAGRPTVGVHGMPLGFAWADQFDAGVSVYVSDYRHTPGNCWPPELKCRSRMHYYLADRQAQSHEPGARAILLDQEGCVAEASTANVLAYREGEGVVSPHLDKVLPGVSVAAVRDLCGELGIPFIERDLTPEELRAADEVWLSSTSICLLPVVRCDAQPIGGGAPGPVYRRVLAAWSRLVSIDIAAQARSARAV